MTLLRISVEDTHVARTRRGRAAEHAQEEGPAVGGRPDERVDPRSPREGEVLEQRSLAGERDALERDHAFLLKGDVFTEELLRTYVDYKRSKEVDAIRQRPHPYEFALYYDI